ncbi:LOW QUALITY PROTEIN: gastric inhibitory polypeptide receptor [Myotis lucifugus]|uniref:LOW QUALITY PROTEIN: gastric inhibitory polypeptide receptor n=1 Tax=Myotis lucifugus TaxID=59463 RepID=UPI000CCBFFC5|nr:LOW QUALITY PROTEIN: gastric inhibitory polypeptide receptor [Myotis lucifugus]
MEGLACNGSFDMYVCWDYAAPNTTARASCPWYLPWHRHVAAGFVLRQCGSDGQWGPWRDHSQCENPEEDGTYQNQMLILERLQVVYTVGYSLSLAALLLALLILSFFRRLHCTRNYIHINLFTSFMLRAAAILTRDRLLPPASPAPGDQAPILWDQALAPCRTAQIVTQYCVGANYTWLLVEGIYLHSLLVLVGGSEGGPFRGYLLFGWGEPRPCPLPARPSAPPLPDDPAGRLQGSLPVSRLLPSHLSGGIPRVLGRARPARVLTAAAGWGVGVGVCTGAPALFVIPWVIVSRFHLTLVPLLGVHEMVFVPVTEEQVRGHLRFAKLGFQDGLLVSFLYCFINKEVQSEIRRGWHRCRLRRSLGEEPHQPPQRASLTLQLSSGPRQVATGRALSSGNLPGPGDEASRVLESYC